MLGAIAEVGGEGAVFVGLEADDEVGHFGAAEVGVWF